MLNLWSYEPHGQLKLPGFEERLPDLATLSRRTLGRLGELTAWNGLEASGYRVQRSRRYQGDLRVITGDGEVLYVEVKTARQCSDNKWRFTLYSRGCDHRHSDVVLLLALLDYQAVPFMIPVKDLPGHQCVITSDPTTYRGRLARFRQDMPLLLP